MSDQLTQALNNLRYVLQSEAHDHCVSVSIFFNSEGHDVEYRMQDGVLEHIVTQEEAIA